MRRMRRVAAVIVALGLAFASLAGASSGSSPPPGKIVYTVATPSPRREQYSLFTARTDRTGVTQLTSPGLHGDVEPRWSPDGARVAYTRFDPDRIYSAVWVVNADGTEPHAVSEGASYAEHPKWSPDGRWIAYQEQTRFFPERDDTAYELWIVRPDGSDRQALHAGGDFLDGGPEIGNGLAWAWAPDSKRIALTYGTDFDNKQTPPKIAVLNLVTGNRRILAPGVYPAWSPDGKRVAFLSGCHLSLVPARGGKPTPITSCANDSSYADQAWSPDGRWIASVFEPGLLSDQDDFRLVVGRPDGRGQSHVPPIRAAAVKWPRDCERMFFYKSYSPHERVGWIVHGKHGAPRWVDLPHTPVDRRIVDWRC
jgi:TolB protein